MDLKQLQASGAFIESPPEPQEVTWVHLDKETGEEKTETFQVFVKRLSVALMDRIITPPDSPKGKKAVPFSRSSALIAAGVLLGDGKGGFQEIPYNMARVMEYSLAEAMLLAFNKVNRRRGGDEEEEGEEVPNA
jgi:hypothetical protein